MSEKLSYCPVSVMYELCTLEENQLTFLNPTQHTPYEGALAGLVMLAQPTSELMAGSNNIACVKVLSKLY